MEGNPKLFTEDQAREFKEFLSREKTLLEDCQEHIRRSSALKIPFQSTSPQRPGFFMNPGQSPDIAPGCYEPLEPRLKDLMASGGDWRQVM
jgi:hypothetical protein